MSFSSGPDSRDDEKATRPSSLSNPLCVKSFSDGLSKSVPEQNLVSEERTVHVKGSILAKRATDFLNMFATDQVSSLPLHKISMEVLSDAQYGMFGPRKKE